MTREFLGIILAILGAISLMINISFFRKMNGILQSERFHLLYLL